MIFRRSRGKVKARTAALREGRPERRHLMNDSPTVSRHTRFGDVLRLPGLAPFKNQLLLGPKGSPQNPFYARLTIGQLERMTPAWRHADLVSGLEFARQEAAAGQLRSLPLYTPEELREDPTRAKASLLFLPGKPGAPYAIIAPGGAYINVAITVEGLPVGARLHEAGYHVFLLQYRCGRRGQLPKPFQDMQAALRYITAHAEALQVRPTDYAVFGFSAGGHVAASTGTLNFGYSAIGLPKPACIVLGYPLVSLEERNMAVNSFLQLYMGRTWRSTLPPTYILDHMDKTYPPTYLWQCRDDEILPFHGNGLAFSKRAKELGVECRFRPVDKGGHGMGVALNSEAQGWLEEAIAFWEAHQAPVSGIHSSRSRV